MTTASDDAIQPTPTFEEICTFCDEIAGRPNIFDDYGLNATPKAYVLHETEQFIVVPCLGALTDHYVLVVPKRHVLSVGWMTAEERLELRHTVDQVSRRLGNLSGSEVAVFEHGSLSFRDKGGACHDHAHIHVVATDRSVADFLDYVKAIVTLEPCDNWIESAAEMVNDAAISYLAIGDAASSFVGPATGAPSGFFRKSLMSWLGGDPAEHDWLVFPQIERLKSIIESGLGPEPTH